MVKRDYIDFQDRIEPLGYLITFRTYGTWLHGEVRGSVDRKNYNRYGTPGMPTNAKLVADETNALRRDPVVLNRQQRKVVEQAIEEVCEMRKYALHAVNARSNHVHCVISCSRQPEYVMNSFKAYATPRLRESSLLEGGTKPWARHGSTPYPWTEEELERAIDYVINAQGDEPFR